ncbi:MAG: hypothetical protein J6U96_03525, partial [Elusimicrobiaceae bacterium]|nr:hypothetical protein [Elusimicrobiaceae bacterium]
IRQEMQHMQQAQAAQVEQETFARSAGQFVQTAGLIRSAGALDKYIQANLAAAEQEIGSQKCKSAQWQEQKKQLQDQAVCHNIEAALYASQVQQAADVYTHFEKTLPRELQESLQDKLQTGQAAASAVELAPGLYESCVSEDGEINIGAASAYLHRYCKQYGGDETKLTQAVKIQLALESKHKLQKKSQAYLDLLACAAAPDGPAESRRLLVAWQGTAQQRKQAEKLAYALEQPSEKKTNAAVFNDLQHQLYAGNLTQQQIDKAFNGGGLSAADALRLKSRCCLAHAGQNDIQDKILFDSVYRFCEKSGLDNKSTQEAVYAVFSSGEDAQTHLKAAEELKKWLVL